MKIQDLKTSWFDFGMSYIYLADLACKDLLSNKPEFDIKDLYISIVYNIKHGIEVNLKSLFVLLEEGKLSKRLEHHDQEKILDELLDVMGKRDIVNLIGKLSEKHKDDKDWIFKDKKVSSTFLRIFNLILKYYQCNFLKNKIGTDFVITDTSNTAFKYPQNTISIELDYQRILEKVTIDDVKELQLDILRLENTFISLWLVIKEALEQSEKNN
jgi:hypothetical protein